MRFSEKLKELRTASGLTQRELAEQMHVSFQTISKWESGINEPDFATLKELAKVLSTTTSELLGEEPTPVVETGGGEQPATTSIGCCSECGTSISGNSKYHRVEKVSPSGVKEIVLVCDKCYLAHENSVNKRIKDINESIKKDEKRFVHRSRSKSLIAGIIVGVLGAIATLVFCIINYSSYGIGTTIVAPLLIGYTLLATIYCLFSDTYISDVFLDVAGWSIKFPGLIFSFDLDGLAWLIVMKIAFAILGFLISVGVFLLAVAISALLSFFSFIPLLLHKQNNQGGNTK